MNSSITCLRPFRFAAVSRLQHGTVLAFALSLVMCLAAMPAWAQTITSAKPAQVVAGGTTAVTITGTGFVAGTTVLVNNTAVPTTYQSPTSMVAQITMPDNATGTVPVQTQNPGGSPSAALQVPVWWIQITGTSPDGTNTGTGRLGSLVTLTTSLSAGSYSSVSWTLTGPGTYSANGGKLNYTPPATLPANPTVTATAYLTSYPSVTDTYTFTLGNPNPVIKTISPSTLLPAGTTTSVSLTGTGFMPGTVILPSMGTVSATYQSPTAMTAMVTLPAGATGNLLLQAQNGAPMGGTSAAVQVPVYSIVLAASNPDGSNTGTARLGVPVSLSPIVNAGAMQSVTWGLQGAGTLSGTTNTGATYTPPQTMPANSSVVISAAMSSNTSIATTYPITLINPVPVVSSALPTQLLTGSTQTVSLVGTGFVPGTVVTLNGSALTTAVVDYNHATVQVPVAANATGTLNLVVQNPAPGGGVGSTVSETLPGNSITLTATTSEGTNTGSAGPGMTVNMSSTVSGTTQTAVNWTVSGPGSITSSGVYTAPLSIPASNAVTITAALVSNPSVTASYQLNLLNPAPLLTDTTPNQVPAGATTTVTLTGSGFVPGTVITTNAGTVSATYQSPTSMTAQVTLPPTASGNLSFQAQNPTPGGGQSAGIVIPVWSINLTATNPDGTNTGTARLGVPVALTPAVNAGTYQTVVWGLQGPGSLTGTSNTGATYTPPQTMPASTTAVITAYMSSAPTVTTSYSINLLNPVPSVASASPAQLLTGSTQTVTLTGSGFLPATTVTAKGSPVATTYIDYNHVSVAVPVDAAATGNISLVAANASPGGGAGAAFPEPIAGTSITLTAVNQDGTNNNAVVALGTTVTFSAAVTGSAQTAVTWSVAGLGTITSSGVYTAPTAVTSGNNAVTVTATLTSNPAVTATYQLNILNAPPTISAAKPTQVVAGATTTVTFTGTNFIPGTVILVNGVPAATTYQSPTVVVAQVAVAAGNTSVALAAQNPAPNGSTGTAIQLPVWSIQIAATSPDGVNTGTGRLASTVSFATTVSAGPYSAVTWTIQGAGTFASNGGKGTYTPPSTLPANTTVTMTAYVTSYPSVTTSYTFTLGYPVPVLKTVSPSTLIPAGTTTTMTLTGSGFMPGTVIVPSVGTVVATYQSATSMTAKVTLPGNAGGNLSLQAQNSAPMGGTSSSLQVPIYSIQLSATNPDGTNTGSARLGVPVKITPIINAGSMQSVTWTLTGPGSLSGTTNTGTTYNPPQSMPSNTNVVISAAMSSNTSIATTYSMTLLNPVPVVSTATPTQLLTGSTQQVTLVGSGFVAGTVVQMNGNSLPTALTDYNHVTIQVPVAADASGNLTLVAQNPTPGGGSGTTFVETITPNAINLTATDQDGTPNDGTADLGIQVALSAGVNGSAQTAVTWSLSGPGTLSTNGVYTAPSTMPASNAVTITATLVSNPAITASYQLNVVNPATVITDISPAQIPAGATTTVTLTGTGFLPATTIVVSSGTVTATYQSPTTMTAQVTLPAGATGNLSVQTQNPTPGGGLSPYFQEAISSPVSVAVAGRILDQTTFGPTLSLIQHVQQEGVTAWLQEQFDTPTTPMANIPMPRPSWCSSAGFVCSESEWWQTALTANDQLRQRVAFALSELFVISTNDGTGMTVPTYHNMLANDAFGNWYQIMKDVTLSPGMGMYLDMVNSGAGSNGQIANENFARENMQLFNMGLFLINEDGTLQLDASGNPIPAYTEAQIQAFARAFTGWTYANADGSTPSTFIGTVNNLNPLVAVEARHDHSSKTLLNGTVLPAGQSTQQDLEGALTNVFNHPNVPPFVCRQLIQHLVTGNPSPAYVARVADVFVDNGNHVRGDMQAVLTAIYTDPEARASDTDVTADGGHLREPILWLTAAMRALGDVNIDPNSSYYSLSNATAVLNEQPYTAASVFNFFPPSYVIPGTQINAPEFALENTASVVDRMSLADSLVNNKIKSFNVDLSATSPLGLVASNPATLINTLNTLFMHGQMDQNMISVLTSELSSVSNLAQRVRVGVYLVITSPQYKISH